MLDAPYLPESVFGALKLFAWSLIVFGPLARRTGTDDTLWSNIVRQVFVLIVMIHGLLFLRIFDATSMLVSYAIYYFGRLWHQARGEDPNPPGARLNLWFHDVVYHVLEGSWSPQKLLQRGWRSYRERRGESGLLRWQRLALAALLSAIIVPRLLLISFHPFPQGSDGLTHAMSLKQLAANQSLQQLYPLGAHALTLVLRNLAVLDETFTWALLGPVLLGLQGIVTFGLLYSFRRGFSESFLVTAILLFTITTPPMPGVQGLLDVHPWHFASLLLPICIYLGAQQYQDAPASGMRAASGALLFLHPLMWGAFMLGTSLGLGVHQMMDRGSLRVGRRVLKSLALGGITATFITLSVGLSRGATLSWSSWLHEVVSVPKLGQPTTDMLYAWPLFTLGTLSALGLLLFSNPEHPRVRIQRHLATSFLGISTLGSLTLFGFGWSLALEGYALVYAPCAALVLGEALGMVREAMAQESSERLINHAAVLVTCALLIHGISSPAWTLPPARQRDELAMYLHIRQEYEAHSWTVVGSPALLTHITGYGWMLPEAVFLQSYPDPRTYAWDPEDPSRAIPTRHVFLLAPRSQGALQTWCETYVEEHEDMRLLRRNDSYALYHIERSPKLERELLQRAWERKNKPRGETP